MKKVLLASLVISISLIIILICVKATASQWDIGGNTVFIIFILTSWSLFSFISVLLYQTGHRKAIGNMWLTIVSSILAFLIGDLVAGFFLGPGISSRMIPDPFVHHKLEPNTLSIYKSDEYQYIQRVNNFGFRGSNIQLNKEPNTYRILMLGDSFTLGKGVRDEQTFSFLLEKSLNDKKVPLKGKNFEVLNAGVDSYTPLLSFLQLQKMPRSLAPDLVILNLDNSDLLQESAYRNSATYGTDGEITGIPGPPPKIKTRQWVDRHMYMTRRILFYIDDWIDELNDELNQHTITNTVVLANPELLRHTLSGNTADRKEQWQNLFDSILKITKYCEEEEIRFLLTLYPWGHQVNEKEWVPGRGIFIPDGTVISDKNVHLVEDFAGNNSITVLNVFSAFRSYDGESPLYFNYDIHWTPMGHEIMARELERFIKATYFSDPNQEGHSSQNTR